MSDDPTNILKFDGITKVDFPPEDVLEGAKAWGMTKCVIVGIDEKGELCFGGSLSDVPLINLLLDHAKLQILDSSNSGFTGAKLV